MDDAAQARRATLLALVDRMTAYERSSNPALLRELAAEIGGERPELLSEAAALHGVDLMDVPEGVAAGDAPGEDETRSKLRDLLGGTPQERHEAGQHAPERWVALCARVTVLALPFGKDATEAHQRGGDLREWLTTKLEQLGLDRLASLGRSILVAQLSVLVASIFISNGYDKVLWVLLALSPILGTIAARSDPDVEESWA